MILKSFDALVMNLDCNPQRWEQVQKDIPKLGVTNFKRLSGGATPGGNAGFTNAHLNCLRLPGEDHRYVFEDDVLFEDGCVEVLAQAIDQLPDDFDMLYLGGNVKMPATRYSENLYKITEGVHMSHAILFSPHARAFILANYDPGTHNLIDEWYYRKGLAMMKAFICYPMIAFQRGGYSDVRQQYFDYRGEMLENAKNNMK
jgi:GR25 family glycosyltransferase involved in LPS biosynthesis